MISDTLYVICIDGANDFVDGITRSEKQNKVAEKERERDGEKHVAEFAARILRMMRPVVSLYNDAYINPPTKRIRTLAIPTIWRIACGREFWVFDLAAWYRANTRHSLRLFVTTSTSASGISDVIIKQKTLMLKGSVSPNLKPDIYMKTSIIFTSLSYEKKTSDRCSCHGYHFFIVTIIEKDVGKSQHLTKKHYIYVKV